MLLICITIHRLCSFLTNGHLQKTAQVRHHLLLYEIIICKKTYPVHHQSMKNSAPMEIFIKKFFSTGESLTRTDFPFEGMVGYYATFNQVIF